MRTILYFTNLRQLTSSEYRGEQKTQHTFQGVIVFLVCRLVVQTWSGPYRSSAATELAGSSSCVYLQKNLGVNSVQFIISAIVAYTLAYNHGKNTFLCFRH